MVDIGNVTADVSDVGLFDAGLFDAVALGATGHLEPIDYAEVARDKTLPGCALEFGTSIILYGYAFIHDTEACPDGAPTSWADFFDVAKFPGMRSLYKWANGSPGAAPMADGVGRDALYPLDLDRAPANVTAIKDSSIYRGPGSETHDMIVNGKVSMGMVWQNRGRCIDAETNGRYKMVTNRAIAMPGAHVVPKGNPGGREVVMKFVAVPQSPDAQLGLLSCLGMTPTNAEAIAMILAEDAPNAITSEANMAVIVLNDPAWWGQTTDAAVNAFLEAIS